MLSILAIITVILMINCVETWFPWRRWSYQDWSSFNEDHELNNIPATYSGIDKYYEEYKDLTQSGNLQSGNDFVDQHFYLCYNREGVKTYHKKMDHRMFKNTRYWLITAARGFVASMELC